MSSTPSAPRPLHVLLLGGYGFFGSRLAKRLAEVPGVQLTIAGRDARQAAAFAAKCQPGTLHVALDTSRADLAARIGALQPQVVINACGPFQGQDHHIPRACIAAGAHCIDLADATTYVTGIAALDADARAAGVAIVSGASSVPALSSAVTDELARDLAVVEHVDIGISPGNRTERGLSTTQAVLSYCGQRIEAAVPQPVFGWSGTWSHAFAAPVGTRLLSPCDVPDLALLPARYPGGPTVRFGAGLELRLLHRGMNVLAWLARRGWVGNWQRHAKPLKAASDLLRPWGSDAGAMHVTVRGRDAQGVAIQRRWQLVATHGDGPFVPTLAAAALVRRLARGVALPVGATACVGLLTPQDILAEAAGLRITTAVDAPQALFPTVMGERYERLHPDLRAFHDLTGAATLHGEVRTQPAQSWLAGLLGLAMGTPRAASQGPLRFELGETGADQQWTRHFPHRSMVSRMSVRQGALAETLGPVRLTFALEEDAGRLRMKLQRMHFLGLPCPAFLLPQVTATEHGGGGRLHFDVSAALPWIGRVAAYQGHLDVTALRRAGS